MIDFYILNLKSNLRGNLEKLRSLLSEKENQKTIFLLIVQSSKHIISEAEFLIVKSDSNKGDQTHSFQSNRNQYDSECSNMKDPNVLLSERGH
jgi:hypothetical protein